MSERPRVPVGRECQAKADHHRWNNGDQAVGHGITDSLRKVRIMQRGTKVGGADPAEARPGESLVSARDERGDQRRRDREHAEAEDGRQQQRRHSPAWTLEHRVHGAAGRT